MILIYWGCFVFALVTAFTISRAMHRPLLSMVQHGEISFAQKIFVQLLTLIVLTVVLTTIFVLMI